MKAETYVGRCFGGPLDGQSLEYRVPFYRAPIRKPMSWEPPLRDVAPTATTNVAEYRHWSIKWTDRGRSRYVPMWVLTDYRTEADVVALLQKRLPHGPD